MNRRRLHVRLAVGTLASAMLLTACGGDRDGGGGSGSEAKADQAAAQAFIEPYEKEPSPFPVTSELAESPSGKKVAFMDVGTPTSALIYQLMAPAAEALDIELTRLDTGQSADTVETAFGTAESGGFDGVVVASLPPSLWERHCRVPGLMEALIPRKDESHGSTEEVPRGASGASDPDGGRSAS